MSETSTGTRIALIVATDRNGLIGARNGLPWRLPADMAHFRELTIGKPVIMGRRTFESLREPLPRRTNIVVTRNPAFRADGAVVVIDLDAALAAAGAVPEVMIIGGAQIYAMALPLATRIYRTEIDAAFQGDTWFPDLDRRQWRETLRETHTADAKNPHRYSFITLERLP
ncbi:MAG: dihydrofolate reductase [Chromatiales bacterium]|nr:dihydrofolate reductase [Chromatiales bacterium]